MVKRSGSIRKRRAVDGKLCSHLEWPKGKIISVLYAYTNLKTVVIMRLPYNQNVFSG